jgi:hypothetical protein
MTSASRRVMKSPLCGGPGGAGSSDALFGRSKKPTAGGQPHHPVLARPAAMGLSILAVCWGQRSEVARLHTLTQYGCFHLAQRPACLRSCHPCMFEATLRGSGGSNRATAKCSWAHAPRLDQEVRANNFERIGYRPFGSMPKNFHLWPDPRLSSSSVTLDARSSRWKAGRMSSATTTSIVPSRSVATS